MILVIHFPWMSLQVTFPVAMFVIAVLFLYCSGRLCNNTFRDNLENIRNSWSGISTDGGASFKEDNSSDKVW
jgi:hypothetical protein